jgi:hypothetical protein
METIMESTTKTESTLMPKRLAETLLIIASECRVKVSVEASNDPSLAWVKIEYEYPLQLLNLGLSLALEHRKRPV